MQIHSTAVIEHGVEIGEGVSIGPFAYVEKGAKVGDGCDIGPRATIFGCVSLGAGCRVHTGAILGDLPQDLAFGGGDTFVDIGCECVIREGVTIHRGTKAGTRTTLGDRCFLMAFSHCAHNVELADGVILGNSALLAGYAKVGAKAFLSGNTSVHQFVSIGRLAMLGGGAVATKDVPPFCTLRGGDLNAVVGLNVVGMRRAGFSDAERLEAKRAYAGLYGSSQGMRDWAQGVKERGEGGPAGELAAFVLSSRRGVCGCRHRRGRELMD
jgi:UDP-N-acetylglucosamine acyltransferase